MGNTSCPPATYPQETSCPKTICPQETLCPKTICPPVSSLYMLVNTKIPLEKANNGAGYGNIIVTGGGSSTLDLCHIDKNECEIDGCIWKNGKCFNENNTICNTIQKTKCSVVSVT